MVELSVQDKPKSRRISSKRPSTISLAVVSSETSPATVNNSKKPPLCRGNSFTFLTPGPPWDFSLKRKHKEPKDDDTVSLSSFDLKKRKRKEKKEDDDTVSLSSFDLKEPSNKRVRPLSRVSSLANLISPSKNGAVRRFGQTIQNMSLRGDSKSPGASLKSCSKAAGPTPPKRRNSTLWSETLDVHQKSTFSTKEIKRQEAIHELSRGEQDLIEDLQMARKAYHDPMLKLSIMTEEELTHIFGDLDSYIPLHEDLLDKLAKGTGPNGTVGHIGQIVVDWMPSLTFFSLSLEREESAAILDHLLLFGLKSKKQTRYHDLKLTLFFSSKFSLSECVQG